MSNKSNKRLALPVKDNVGCMWGLISMFDFQGVHATRKLLPNKKHGNDTAGTGYSRVKDHGGLEEKHTKNIDGGKSEEVNLGITTIKRRMEQEMNRRHLQKRITHEELQFIISDFGSEAEYRKKCRERSNKSKVIFNAVDSLTTIASMDSQQPECIDSTERPSINFDLAALLIELYGYYDKCQTIHADSNDVLNFCLSLKALCEKLHSYCDQPNVMLDQKEPVLRRVLAGVAEDILTQNSITDKLINEKMCVQSNELTDAFKILSSKRELLLKLLQDPDSPLFKHVQDTQNAHVTKYSKFEADRHAEKVRLLQKENGSSEKCEETDSAEMSHKQSKSIFFWKKHEVKGTKTSRGSQSSHPLNRIVVLKPNPERMHCSPITRLTSSSTPSKYNQGHEEDGERVTSHFSLNEIKRKLKLAFLVKKKEHNMISMDRVLHKIPMGCKHSVDISNQFGDKTVRMRSARRPSCANEKSTDTLTTVKKKNKKLKAEDFEFSLRRDCASPLPGYLIYEEARNHHTKRRSSGDQMNSMHTVQVSKSSGMILSLPGCNKFPCHTLESKKETSFIMEVEHSPAKHLAPKDTKSTASSLTKSLEISSVSEIKENSQSLMLDIKKTTVDSHMEERSYVREGLNQGGSIELDKAKVHISVLEPYQSEVLTESNDQELDDGRDRLKEEYSNPESNSSEEKSQSVIQADSSPSSPIIKKLYTLEQTNETFDTPIPVHILKTTVSEDIITPGGRDVDYDKLQMQPQQRNSEYNDNFSIELMLPDTECIDESQARYQYAKAVLHAAGLTTTNELLERWLWGDKLLDPSLFDEVTTSYCHVLKDRKLLFDYIGDVLVQMHESYFKHGLPCYFIKSSIQQALSGEKLMNKVIMGITRYNRLQPKTVDEMIQKDLQSRIWVDFELETENIAIDVCDTILDDLVEEAVFDLWF